MEEKPKPLPGLNISDESVEGSGWVWSDGWHGLVPSRSKLEDATKVLGQFSERSELSNGVTYDFLGGSVRVTIKDDDPSVFKIWIDRSAQHPFRPPETINDAMAKYGKLKVLSVDRREGALYERPGMRICCKASTPEGSLLWQEIYKPHPTG